MDVEFLHCLIVIDTYGTELLVQFGEPGNVFECRPVCADDPELFGKDTGGNELCH